MEPKKEYIIQSLSQQLSRANIENANKDAIIEELYKERNQLTEDLEQYRNKEIETMDEESE